MFSFTGQIQKVQSIFLRNTSELMMRKLSPGVALGHWGGRVVGGREKLWSCFPFFD